MFDDYPKVTKIVDGQEKVYAQVGDRLYSRHALERMAPDTPEVRAILEKRAIEVAEAKGYTHGSEKWYDFIKGYVDPRGIPPMVVEDAIKNGTRIPGNTSDIIECFTDDVSVFINLSGDVVTVIPK